MARSWADLRDSESIREFVRRAKRYARKVGLDFRFVARESKGSHGRLYGSRMTMVKRTELSKALLHSMLEEPEIEKGDFWP